MISTLPRANLVNARPQAVVFDWDNTLVDTWPVIHQALMDTFARMGHEQWSFDTTRARVRQSLRDSFPVLFGDRWEEARDHYYEAFGNLHLQAMKPLPDAEDLLKGLVAEGIYLAVVSNKTGRFLRLEAEHVGWGGYFSRILGAGDAERDKPAPDPLHAALDGSGILAGDSVWFVGDSGVDMEIAHATGCRAVLVKPETEIDPVEFEKHPPDIVFPGCAGLLEFFKGLS